MSNYLAHSEGLSSNPVRQDLLRHKSGRITTLCSAAEWENLIEAKSAKERLVLNLKIGTPGRIRTSDCRVRNLIYEYKQLINNNLMTAPVDQIAPQSTTMHNRYQKFIGKGFSEISPINFIYLPKCLVWYINQPN